MDAKQSSDVNVTVRSRSSNRVEQITVESGNEDIGSSMHRIGSNLLHVVLCDHSSKKEATTMEFPADLLHVVLCDHSNERWKLEGIPS